MDRPSLDNFKSIPALLRFIIPLALGLAVDLWTKILAVDHLKESGDTIKFIPDWLHFRYTENHGAVFGLGQGQRLLFITVSIGAIGFLSYLFASSGKRRLMHIVIGMLLAGVLGNMYDRIVHGYVRDMIYALPGWYWPGSRREIFPWIFNIADTLLCVGVAIMVLLSFFQPEAPAAPGAEASQKMSGTIARAEPVRKNEPVQ
jgi:signal peptidase II